MKGMLIGAAFVILLVGGTGGWIGLMCWLDVNRLDFSIGAVSALAILFIGMLVAARISG